MFNDIDKNAHYFLLMKPLEVYHIRGITVTMKSSDAREKWVECEIIEDKYKLQDNYKIELKALDENYGKESFYITDFLSLLEQGDIIKKEYEDMECVELNWIEPINHVAYYQHSAYVLKRKELFKK